VHLKHLLMLVPSSLLQSQDSVLTIELEYWIARLLQPYPLLTSILLWMCRVYS